MLYIETTRNRSSSVVMAVERSCQAFAKQEGSWLLAAYKADRAVRQVEADYISSDDQQADPSSDEALFSQRALVGMLARDRSWCAHDVPQQTPDCCHPCPELRAVVLSSLNGDDHSLQAHLKILQGPLDDSTPRNTLGMMLGPAAEAYIGGGIKTFVSGQTFPMLCHHTQYDSPLALLHGSALCAFLRSQ